MEAAGKANQDRRAWMGHLAKAPKGQISELLDSIGPRPSHTWLRAPEVGSVMVQGRTSATGAPFNLGEMTVTRCALRLDSGEVGHAYIQGRRKPCAEAAALVDALMQTDQCDAIRTRVLDALVEDAKTRRAARSEKAAATKVDFFTMVRGED